MFRKTEDRDQGAMKEKEIIKEEFYQNHDQDRDQKKETLNQKNDGHQKENGNNDIVNDVE
jgi:hypothetical protein